MALAALAVAFVALIVAGYRLYGRFLARHLALDDARPTPAVTRADQVDFVPTPRFYLFAQHLSAIAAAGPIAGPILACESFGWLPCLLWIGFGVVFIGAVHDFSALVASVRHRGTSIAEVARAELGGPAGRAMLAFIWIALIYVIVAFADITAGTFVSGGRELAETNPGFHPGGAVTGASALYLLLAIAMGFLRRRFALSLALSTAIFVPATFAAAWVGTRVSGSLVLDYRTCVLAILVYCVVASIIPVWALLQPRGYLGGFVLLASLVLGIVGMLFGGYAVEQPALRGWSAPGAGTLAPFLFVTIACGACSGFHGLVCSGTTSKQVARESHTLLVGYGAMLAEGLVALIALFTVMIVGQDATRGLAPGTIYGNGLGRFMTLIIGEEHLLFATTFGAMAFSTFVFDTLDVCTRLGRYLLQELFGWKGRAGATAATLLTIAPPAAILSLSQSGAYRDYWTLFGASNQLLAALTLLAVAVWARRSGRSSAFALLPMLFVVTMTTWALVGIAGTNLARAESSPPALVNAAAAVALLALALFFGLAGLRSWRAAARRPFAEPEPR